MSALDWKAAERWLAERQAEMCWHNDGHGCLSYVRSTDGCRLFVRWRHDESALDAIARQIAKEAEP